MSPSLTRSMQANTTTTISSSGSGTNLILTAKVSPAGVTGSVVFYAGPIDNGIQLATIFLVHGVARLSRFPQGGLSGNQEVFAVYLGTSDWNYSVSNTIHVKLP